MNASKFKLGTPYYYGDGDIYVMAVDYRWRDVIDFFTKVINNTSTFTDYKKYLAVLNHLSADDGDQQALYIGDYAYNDGSNTKRGFLIPQWADLVGNKKIVWARWGDSPEGTFTVFADLIAPIISAMRVSRTIHYDTNGNQVTDGSQNIQITVEINGFRLDTDSSLALYPCGWTSGGTLALWNVKGDGDGEGWIITVGPANSNIINFSTGYYTTAEFYSFEKLTEGIVSLIVSGVSKQFVQR